MTKYINTQTGSFISGSEIVNVSQVSDSMCSIATRGGDSYIVDDHATNIVNIIEEHDDVIAAFPGFRAIRMVSSGKGGELEYELRPVVGWLKFHGNIYDQDKDYIGYPHVIGSIPIVAGSIGSTEAPCDWSLLLPDGRVIDVWRVFGSIDEWLAVHGCNVKGRKKASKKKADI